MHSYLGTKMNSKNSFNNYHKSDTMCVRPMVWHLLGFKMSQFVKYKSLVIDTSWNSGIFSGFKNTCTYIMRSLYGFREQFSWQQLQWFIKNVLISLEFKSHYCYDSHLGVCYKWIYMYNTSYWLGKHQKNVHSNPLESMYLTHLQVACVHIGRSVKC